LKRGEESCVLIAKGSDTWPEIAGIEKREKERQRCLKINFKF